MTFVKLGLYVGFLSLSVASVAFAEATPRVGDKTSYLRTNTVGDTVTTMAWAQEIVGNNSDGTFEMRWIQNGRSLGTATVTEAGLNYIADIKAFCETQNVEGWEASLEEVSVPAGNFLACKIEKLDRSYSLWMSAKIPFGFVKDVTTADGAHCVQELQSVRR